MNLINPLKQLHARLYSAELSAAAWIDTRPVGRTLTLLWYHQGLRPWAPAAMTVPAMALGGLSRAVFTAFAGVAVAATVFARVAVKSHYILNEEDRPCPYCPTRNDDDGHGGVWLNLGDDIPPAPAPMPDYGDQQIRDWAADADAWLARLTADIRRAEMGDAS